MSIEQKTGSDGVAGALICLTLFAIGALASWWSSFREEMMSTDPGLTIAALVAIIIAVNLWRWISNKSVFLQRRVVQGFGWIALHFLLCLVIMTIIFQNTTGGLHG